MTCLQIPEAAAPIFWPAKYKSLRGGRGSSKTHSFAQLAVALAAGLLIGNGYEDRPYRIASARSTEVAIKQSVKQTIEGYIRKLGLGDEFDCMAMEIRNHRTGSLIFFPGVSGKVESWLSIEDVDVFWMEQAEQLEDEMTLIEPSIRKASAEYWFSWNPGARTQWCWDRFMNKPMPGDINILMNWRDNPWWADTGLEDLRRRDEMYEPEIYGWKWEGAPLDNEGQSTVLPYAMLRKCVDAYTRGLAPAEPAGARAYAGLDLAEGGVDKCSLVVRAGPTIRTCEAWPGVTGDLSVAARTARDLTADSNIVRIYYDAAAPAKTDLLRAGFKGVMAVNFGGEVGGGDSFYEPGVRNRDIFARRNIQMAMALRLRAQNTVALLEGRPIDPAECLFIDPAITDLEVFLSELSQPTRRFNTTTGRWELEKAAVGERSPDRFDAACLAFARQTHNRGLRVR